MVEVQHTAEKRPNKELSIHQFRESYALSNRLYGNTLTDETGGHLTSTNSLPNTIIEAVGNGSHTDRLQYWEKQKVNNWGEQMIGWLDGMDLSGKHIEGMTDWVESQREIITKNQESPTAEALFYMLGNVGLIPVNPTQTAQDMSHVEDVFKRINQHLQQDGKGQFEIQDDATFGSLIFYSRYLDAKNPSQRTDMTQKLLYDLVEGAAYGIDQDITDRSPEERNGMAEIIFQRLELVAPLLAVTGEDAQHAVAALLAARVHGVYESEKVVEAGKSFNELQDHEQYLLHLVYHYQHSSESSGQQEQENTQVYEPAESPTETSTPDEQMEGEETESQESKEFALQRSEHYRPEEVYRKVTTPVLSGGNDYFVTKDIAPDTAEKFAQERGLESLEVKKPVFDNISGFFHFTADISQEVFPADTALSSDKRYSDVKKLLSDEGYLLALSAASAESPERQAQLYKALSQVVLDVHKHNPDLFREFLEAQTNSASETYIAYTEKDGGVTLQDELGQFFDSGKVMSEEDLARLRDIHASAADMTGNGERLVAMRFAETKATPIREPYIDIEKTVKGWEGRVDRLRELLQNPEVFLTPAEMRQIEFLAHAVDVTKVVEWLNGREVDRTKRPTSPEAPDTMRSDMGIVPPGPVEEEETMGPPPAATEKTEDQLLNEAWKRPGERKIIKDIVDHNALDYSAGRFLYLRSLLLPWPDEARQNGFVESLGHHVSKEDMQRFMHDVSLYQNPGEILEFDSDFIGSKVGNVSTAQATALHQLFGLTGEKKTLAEFAKTMSKVLGMKIPTETMQEVKQDTSTPLSPHVREQLLSLENRATDVISKFSEEEKRVLRQLLEKLPTRVDQLMAILYYYVVLKERNGSISTQRPIISRLRGIAKRTETELGKDELTYFASSQSM